MVRDFSDKITWVVVADGHKSVFLRNFDSDSRPDLRVLAIDEIENPLSHRQGTSRPGRTNESQPGVIRKSALDETDFHQLAKSKFAGEISDRLEIAANRDEFDRLVLVAPPKTLGELRAQFSTKISSRIVAEINRDLTRHPIEDIEKQVASAFATGRT